MKKVNEIMSSDVTCATPDSSLVEISQLMIKADCGEIPIVNSLEKKDLIGVITDRDIVCRTLGVGRNPLELHAVDCMTKNVVTTRPEMSIDDCLELMRINKIRRIPVVDDQNFLCGIVSQADLVKYADEEEAIEMIQEVSTPGLLPSAIH